VVKHAGTSQAVVTVEKSDRNASILIADHGSGFDVKTVMADPQTAHGLLIIRDRLKLMGGTLKIESAAGEGTRALIEFPVENPSA
jgi:signal transduction histidine kinase